jgi:hypothetical protein
MSPVLIKPAGRMADTSSSYRVSSPPTSRICKPARDGHLAEQQLVDFLEQLLRIVTLKKNLQALENLSIDPRGLFTSVKPARLPKLRAFLEKRLPREL